MLSLQPHKVFLSPDSAIGFGAGDYVALLLAMLLIAWTLRPRKAAAARGPTRVPFAQRTTWGLLFFAALPIVLRLALLRYYPLPIGTGADDFSFLLLGDTFRHFRFANPPHALPQFFEQVFVLQRPTYSSMYPPGQGIVLALGWLIFSTPWAGVLLAEAAFCGLCYWMLRGWTTAGWAFLGGLLAVFEFGPLCYWMNCYWGGAVSACAGCLVFGSLPRRNSILLGIGLAIQLLTRPFEFCLLFLCVLPYLPSFRKALAIPAVILAAAGGVMLLQDKQVTGRWTTMPYQLHQYQYGIPASFAFQPNPIPHAQLNSEQEQNYRAGVSIHDEQNYVERLWFRVRFLRFFFYAPLCVAVLVFVVTLRTRRDLWILGTACVFLLGTNLYPFFYPHYIAAITCLFILISVEGLAKLDRKPHTAAGLFVLCAAQFLFWYGIYASGNPQLLAFSRRYESWDYINYGDPQYRRYVAAELARFPGKQLIFVRYSPGHQFSEWIHNAADVDASRVVFAHDLGVIENQQLLSYYPDRRPWLLEPDENPPALLPYKIDKSPFVQVQ